MTQLRRRRAVFKYPLRVCQRDAAGVGAYPLPQGLPPGGASVPPRAALSRASLES
jgi:hypothetical protein